MPEISIHWFRRDLRLHDNAALYHALRLGQPVLPVFIFDTDILDDLQSGNGSDTDKRVEFIYREIKRLKDELNQLGSDLLVYYGKPAETWKKLTASFEIKHVFANCDYEPYATKRDTEVHALLERSGIRFHSYKDQVIFEKNEIVKDDGKPYTVFTPYMKKWRSKLNDFCTRSYPTEKNSSGFLPIQKSTLIDLQEMGFATTATIFPRRAVPNDLVIHYDETRDTPSVKGTSRLGLHLRFGTISIRDLARQAIRTHGEKFLDELIWREFYMMILWHFPQVVDHCFRKEYDRIQWRNNKQEFKLWCEGNTGYPIVDAGMRELNETGFMHNRVRMITASFLTKHLLIDWRWGEAYFAKKLLDYELASNNGGWQWAAGTGVDAAPYFRIFNPALQTEKFDPKLEYVRKWVPEFNTPEYPRPVVEHESARKRCLEVYQAALKGHGQL